MKKHVARLPKLKAQNTLLVVLVLTAVVLGVFVVRAYSEEVQAFLQKFSSGKQKEISSSSSTTGPTLDSSQMRQLPEGLTDDEKALLTPPAPDASKEEKDKHFALVQKFAKESEVLDLKGCTKPDPLVLQVKDGAEFKAKSSDGAEHTIVINQDFQFKIPKGETATFTANFPFGQGAYGYLCDTMPGVVGFFSVTPK